MISDCNHFMNYPHLPYLITEAFLFLFAFSIRFRLSNNLGTQIVVRYLKAMIYSFLAYLAFDCFAYIFEEESSTPLIGSPSSSTRSISSRLPLAPFFGTVSSRHGSNLACPAKNYSTFFRLCHCSRAALAFLSPASTAGFSSSMKREATIPPSRSIFSKAPLITSTSSRRRFIRFTGQSRHAPASRKKSAGCTPLICWGRLRLAFWRAISRPSRFWV